VRHPGFGTSLRLDFPRGNRSRSRRVAAVSVPVDDPVIQVCVRALGIDIDLAVTGQQLAQAVSTAWQDALTETSEQPTSRLTVALGTHQTANVCGGSIEEVLHHLSPAVTQAAIGHWAGELMMLHAAALADPESGATAVLVAASGTGKTTASRTLGRRFAYVSDETAGITRDGLVLPYRKPLSIIERGHLKTQVAPSTLGLLATTRECRIGALLLLDRQPDHAGPPTVTPVDTIDAIAAIAPQSSYLPSVERPLQRLAQLVRLAGGAHRATYREAADLEQPIAQLLRKSA
jgi:hypothetical protein